MRLHWGYPRVHRPQPRGPLLPRGGGPFSRHAPLGAAARLGQQSLTLLLAPVPCLGAASLLVGKIAHRPNQHFRLPSLETKLGRLESGIHSAQTLRAIDAIETVALRGQDLTRHLLSFARRQRLQTTVAPLAERMTGVRELVTTSLPAHIQLELDIPEDLWPVEVDQAELDLAILNLAVNARDAMPKGGRLTISARNTTLPPSSDTVSGEIAIADTGTGIAPDILAKIFEPFFTTKEVNKGTGLGLSHVYGFAQQAGGEVRVESTLGKGTTFSIYLPRSQAEPTVIAPSVEPRGTAGPAHILLVEDNPDVAEVATGLLEQLGHKVSVAINAAAALSALQDGAPPDLVFSDIVMAGELDGVALARLLRERHPDLAILLATGYSQAAESLNGEFLILRKPYKLSELKTAVDQVLLENMRPPIANVVPISQARRGRTS